MGPASRARDGARLTCTNLCQRCAPVALLSAHPHPPPFPTPPPPPPTVLPQRCPFRGATQRASRAPTYASLITMAIYAAPDKRLTLKEIL